MCGLESSLFLDVSGGAKWQVNCHRQDLELEVGNYESLSMIDPKISP